MIAKRIAQFLVITNSILVLPATAAAIYIFSIIGWEVDLLPISLVIFLLWLLGISLFTFYIRTARAKTVRFPRIWWSLSALANGIPFILSWNRVDPDILTGIITENYIIISIYVVTTILSIIALFNPKTNSKMSNLGVS